MFHLALSLALVLSDLAGPVAASPVAVEILPSFDAPYCARRATHVVVVDEGAVLDGKVRVLRSLVGDLAIGAELELPDLAKLAPDEQRRLFDFGSSEPARVLSGRTLLLYLVGTDSGWRGAGWGEDLLLSFAWLEPEGPCARLQVINPGPLLPTRLHRSVADLLSETLHIVSDRRARETALAVEDEAARAAALETLLLTGAEPFRAEYAELLLSRGGASGLLRTRDLLAEERRLELHPIVLWALIRFDEPAGRRALDELLVREQRFWIGREVAPERFTSTAPPEGELAGHYRRLHALLRHVNDLGGAGDGESLDALLDFWEKHPDLDEWLRYTVGYRIAAVVRQIRRR